MNDLVLDASAALELLLLPGDSVELIESVAQADRVAAPQLFVSESANALWKYVRAHQLEEGEAVELMAEACALVVHPISDADMVIEALTTSTRYGHPAYDAMYAVLARRLGCPVATKDDRLRELLEELRIPWI